MLYRSTDPLEDAVSVPALLEQPFSEESFSSLISNDSPRSLRASRA
jgi:hypothetical protein